MAAQLGSGDRVGSGDLGIFHESFHLGSHEPDYSADLAMVSAERERGYAG
jgi:hypothetical protein